MNILFDYNSSWYVLFFGFLAAWAVLMFIRRKGSAKREVKRAAVFGYQRNGCFGAYGIICGF